MRATQALKFFLLENVIQGEKIKTQRNWHTAYLGRLPWRNMFWRLLWRHLQPAPVPELSGPSLKFCKGSLVCCKLNVKRIPFCWGQEQGSEGYWYPRKILKGCIGSNDGIIATLNPDPGLAERDGQSVKASKKEYYFVIILLFEPSLMNLL